MCCQKKQALVNRIERKYEAGELDDIEIAKSARAWAAIGTDDATTAFIKIKRAIVRLNYGT